MKGEENKIVTSVSLSPHTIVVGKRESAIMDASFSGFIDYVVAQWFEKSDPVKELKAIKKKKEELDEAKRELDLLEMEVIKKLEYHKETTLLRSKQKAQAIEIIKRKIMENDDPFHIEHIARNWGYRLDMPYQTLIFEASQSIKESGI